jgi:hypothetical protein
VYGVEVNPQRQIGTRLKEALPDQLAVALARGGGGAAAISRSLGKWIGHRKGQWMLGYTVREAGKDPKTKVALWRTAKEGSR